MDCFLDMLGQRVDLRTHKKYSGGLDTVHGLTGEQSIYTEYDGNEIMFHVSTLLPHSPRDPQQLQRKRHIGNDIVCIVFQEDSAVFRPDIIKSNFLHVFILVQPSKADHSIYKVTVLANSDVPSFSPKLPVPSVFKAGSEFRCWLLAKLIKSEKASYRAKKFSKLRQRTRGDLLDSLVNNLTECAKKENGSKMEREHSFFRSVRKVMRSKAENQWNRK